MISAGKWTSETMTLGHGSALNCVCVCVCVPRTVGKWYFRLFAFGHNQRQSDPLANIFPECTSLSTPYFADSSPRRGLTQIETVGSIDTLLIIGNSLSVSNIANYAHIAWRNGRFMNTDVLQLCRYWFHTSSLILHFTWTHESHMSSTKRQKLVEDLKTWTKCGVP